MVKKNRAGTKFPLLVAALLLAGAVVFAGGKKETLPGTTRVRIGIVGEAREQWKPVIAKLAPEGILIEIVDFSDYVTPNRALEDGEIELNSFQHYAFLNNEIATKGYHLTPIGETLIAPLGLYSTKIKSVAELKNRDKIAIPNDVVNGGRALRVLEVAGLITIPVSAGPTPNLSDITSNRLNLEFVEVEAAQTPRLLQDVTASIINGGHAVDFGFNPERDSIALERQIAGSTNPYINVIAARTADKDNPVYKRIVDAYHTPEVKEVFETVYKGAYLAVW
jgi:D-methionine transport system substrate-binding protein